MAVNLLGRQVADRAHYQTRGREHGERDPGVGAAVGSGKTEIENLDPLVTSDEDVFRFDVAMDDALRVRGRQRLGHLGTELSGFAPRQRAAGKPSPQRLAFEQLHDRKRLIADECQLVNREDAGMRERRHRTRLALEAAAHVRIGGQMLREDLDRDVALESQVTRAVHLAHAAAAERLQNLVLREACACGDQ